jgi:hypothetical protein
MEKYRVRDICGVLLVLKPIAVHYVPLNDDLVSTRQQEIPTRFHQIHGIGVQAHEHYTCALVCPTRPPAASTPLLQRRTAKGRFERCSRARELPAVVSATDAIRLNEPIGKGCTAMRTVLREHAQLTVGQPKNDKRLP